MTVTSGFHNRRVLSLESRRVSEVAALIERCGGVPVVVPALRIVPPEPNAEVAAALPEDLSRLRGAVAAIAGGGIDVLLVTAVVEVIHLWQVVAMLGCEAEFRHGLRRTLIASIGPEVSDELARWGLAPDVEASRPALDALVEEAASAARGLVLYPVDRPSQSPVPHGSLVRGKS